MFERPKGAFLRFPALRGFDSQTPAVIDSREIHRCVQFDPVSCTTRLNTSHSLLLISVAGNELLIKETRPDPLLNHYRLTKTLIWFEYYNTHRDCVVMARRTKKKRERERETDRERENLSRRTISKTKTTLTQKTSQNTKNVGKTKHEYS